MASNTETVISRPNPYVGPRSFKKGETLYGREQESSELVDLLIAQRIVMMYSPSGAGKSSILNAVLIPRLEAEDFEVLPVMRVNLEPPPAAELDENFNRYVYSALLSVEEAVPETRRLSQNELASLPLKDYLVRYRERAKEIDAAYDDSRPLVLIVDQGEEIITIAPTEREQKQQFFNQLAEVLRNRSIWLLYSLREDYVARLDSYIKPVPTGFSSRYRLRLLSAEAALSCIRKPAEAQGVAFTEEAARKLADDLRMVQVQNSDGTTTLQPGLYVEPVQLQVVCRRIWTDLDRDDDEISIADIESLGDVNTALADYYALQVAAVAAKAGVRERAVREWFDRKLITSQGIRGQVLMAPRQSDGLENDAIRELERTYLVRAEKRGGATWFELAHDRLIEPVRQNNARWFDANLSILQRAADAWNAQGRSDGMLLFGPDYLAAEEWAKQNQDDLLPMESDFLGSCRALHERTIRERRTNRIIRVLFVVSLVALVLAIAGGIYAFQQARIATAREHIAAANDVVGEDPQLAALIALRAIEESDNTTEDLVYKSQEALHRALVNLRVERYFEAHTRAVYSVFFDANETRFVSASADGTAVIWDYASGRAVKTLSDAGLDIRSAVFSPDGKRVITGDAAGLMAVWDVESGALLQPPFQAHDGTIWSIQFNADGTLLLSGGSGGKVKIWDGQTYENLRAIDANSGYAINVVRFSPDGTRFAAGDGYGVAHIWDTETGELVTAVKHVEVEGYEIQGLAFSPDGKRIITTGTDQRIVLWSTVNGRQLAIQQQHSDWVYAAEFTPDGNTLVTVSGDRTVRLWRSDGINLNPLLTISGFFNQLFSVDLSSDGRRALISSGDGVVYEIDISPQGGRDYLAISDIAPTADTIDFTPDGERIAVTGGDTIRWFDAITGALMLESEAAPGAGLKTVDHSPDGKWLASAARDKRVYVFDTASGKLKATLESASKDVNWAAFAPDNRRVAVSSDDGFVYIFDIDTAKAALKLIGSDSEKPRQARVSALEFTPDGRYLVAGVNELFWDNVVGNNRYYLRIWDASTGNPVRIIENPDVLTEYIWKIDSSNDSSLLAVSFDESTGDVPIWNIAPGPNQWSLAKTLTGNAGIVFTLDFNEDGKFLITGSADKTMRLWDVEQQKQVITFFGVSQFVNSARFSPNGRQIANVGDSPAVVRIYEVDREALLRLAYRRLTRWWTLNECRQYLQTDTCPAPPENFTGRILPTPQPTPTYSQP
jgi:WD40 repeat protein